LPGARLQKAVLDGVYAKAAILAGADLDGAQLSDTVLDEADCRNTTFRGATLSNVFFRGAMLEGADFEQATLMNVDFTGSSVTWGQITKTKVRTDLTGEMIPVERDWLMGVSAAESSEDLLRQAVTGKTSGRTAGSVGD
jgi:uncharacterized protein YjbI with pentapeptide repeats